MAQFKTFLSNLGIPPGLPLGTDAVISGSCAWYVLRVDCQNATIRDNTPLIHPLCEIISKYAAPTWKPNDVDIFCCKSAVPRMLDYLQKNGFKLSKWGLNVYTKVKTFIINWSFPDGRDYPHDSAHMYHLFSDSLIEHGLPVLNENGIPVLNNSCKFGVHDKRRSIQLIISLDSIRNASELIVGKFDFPALENYYDGQHLSVSNLEDVLEGMTYIRKEFRITKKEHVQYDNYLKGAYGAYHRVDNDGNHIHRLLGRVQKYKQRGLTALRLYL